MARRHKKATVGNEKSKQAEGEARKRELIASLEAMRDQGRCGKAPEMKRTRSSESADSPEKTSPPQINVTNNDVKYLHEELRSARATCALLEEETKHLEQKALKAIAEAGELRRIMDTWRAEGGPQEGEAKAPIALFGERERLRRCLREAEEERLLLTRALSDSESEITRLGKTVDLLIRKVKAA